MNYVLCVSNEGYEASLEPRTVYPIPPSKWGDKHGMLRVIDETGEDSMLETDRFTPVELPDDAAATAFDKVAV